MPYQPNTFRHSKELPNVPLQAYGRNLRVGGAWEQKSTFFMESVMTLKDENSHNQNKMQCHVVTILPDGIYTPDIEHRLFWYRHEAEKFVAQWVLLNQCDQCRIEKLVIE